MIPGKIRFLEATRLEHRHRQRVAQRKHRRRAGRGREVERTRFARDSHVEDHVAVSRERRSGRAGDRNDFDRKSLERREQVQQFLGFARITERENRIAIGDDAEVAV